MSGKITNITANMKISKDVLDTMMKQISLDCNVAESEEIAPGIFLAPSKVLEGSRIPADMDPFFRVVVFMGKAYVMADELIMDRTRQILADVKPEWFFTYRYLRSIDEMLQNHGRQIFNTHLYNLPADNCRVYEATGEEIWIGPDEIDKMRDTNVCHSALAYSPTQPDVIAVMYKDGDKIMGMAGASRDGKYVLQIGINVLSGYEGRGIAARLVSLLKDRIIADGDLPFYGTCESHEVSRTVAINSGFMPAFAEMFAMKKDNKR